jgi:hypothetical protein
MVFLYRFAEEGIAESGAVPKYIYMLSVENEETYSRVQYLPSSCEPREDLH